MSTSYINAPDIVSHWINGKPHASTSTGEHLASVLDPVFGIVASDSPSNGPEFVMPVN